MIEPRHCENVSRGCCNFFMAPLIQRGPPQRFCGGRCRNQQHNIDWIKNHGEKYSVMNIRRWRARKRKTYWDAVNRARMEAMG